METLSGEITTSTAACPIAGIPSLSLCSAVQRSRRGRDVLAEAPHRSTVRGDEHVVAFLPHRLAHGRAYCVGLPVLRPAYGPDRVQQGRFSRRRFEALPLDGNAEVRVR